jgi:hypothetical protein
LPSSLPSTVASGICDARDGLPGPPGGPSSAWPTEAPPGHSPRESPRRPYLVGRHLRLLHVANLPTVVIGDRPGGSSSRRYATQPSASRVTVPRIVEPHDPDQQFVPVSRLVRPGPSSGSGSGCMQADSKSSCQLLPMIRTYVQVPVTLRAQRTSCPISTTSWGGGQRPRDRAPRVDAFDRRPTQPVRPPTGEGASRSFRRPSTCERRITGPSPRTTSASRPAISPRVSSPPARAPSPCSGRPTRGQRRKKFAQNIPAFSIFGRPVHRSALSGETEQKPLAHDDQSAHEVFCTPILSTSSPWTAPLLIEHNREELVDGTLSLSVVAPHLTELVQERENDAYLVA